MLTFLIAIWIVCQFPSFSSPTPPSCKSTLLSDLPDTAFMSSSNVSQKYSASAAKMSPVDGTLQYRAWCPDNLKPHEEKEFLEVDLREQSFVRLIITKGLSTADKGGLYLTPYYYIWYRRETSNTKWIKYQNIYGTTRIKGNLDAQTEHYVSMNPPFAARWVRIYPFTQERQPVCLKLEIVGCSANGIVEYQAPRGTFVAEEPKNRLVDFTYDNPESRQSQDTEFPRNAFNSGGLGKLVDGKPDHETDVDPLESNTFVGWKRADDASYSNDYERLVFRFDGIYKFTGVSMLFANQVGNEDSRPRQVEVRLNRKFPRASSTDPATTLTVVHQFPELEVALPKTAWVHVDMSGPLTESSNNSSSSRIYDNVGTFVELRVYYAGSWIALGEVTFENARVKIPPGLVLDEDSEEALATSARMNERNSSFAVSRPQYSLSAMQPHTYALVVGLGCLASVLIILILVFIVHWRRGAFMSKRKADGIRHSFQTPFTTPLIKATSPISSEADQKWDFYNKSSAIQIPMYLNGESIAYSRPSSTAIIPQFLLHQHPPLMLQNYMRNHIQSNQANEEHPTESCVDKETLAALFPFCPSISNALTPESSAIYTAMSESDPYVNGTPRPNQIFRIPPPPSLPLPPTPTQPRSQANQMPLWTVGAANQEQDDLLHASGDLNTFYRYSIPLNGAFPYPAPVWLAGTVDPEAIGRFYSQHQASLQEHPHETQEPNEYLSGTPVSSIIYGGFYGMRDQRQGQTGSTTGALPNQSAN